MTQYLKTQNIIIKSLGLVTTFIIAFIMAIAATSNAEAAGKTRLTKAGDILQIANPVAALLISSQEKGIGHFGVVYGESMMIMGAAQLFGKHSKWGIGKRPDQPNQKSRFDGFPSGHTTSAWAAASYVRVFSEDYKMLSIPLYAAAGITGYSRVKARKHTVTQVVMAAALSESVTMINEKMNWSNEYRSTQIGFSPDGFMANFRINF